MYKYLLKYWLIGFIYKSLWLISNRWNEEERRRKKKKKKKKKKEMESRWKFFLDKFNLKFILKKPPSPSSSAPRSLDNGTIDKFKCHWQSAEHLLFPPPPCCLEHTVTFRLQKKKKGGLNVGTPHWYEVGQKTPRKNFFFLKQIFVGRAYPFKNRD